MLGQNLPWLENVERAKRPARLPLVLTKEEVKAILAQLQQQDWLMTHVKGLHLRDLQDGFGRVHLPWALNRKYPQGEREWGWQYVFPAATRSSDPISKDVRRHHVGEWVLQKAVKGALRCEAVTEWPPAQ